MKKIIVPVDYSRASLKALGYAASLADMLKSELHLLHVYLEPAYAGEAPAPWFTSAADLKKDQDTRLHQEIAFLQEKFPIRIQGHTRVGFKADTIRSEAEDLKADLIVMGLKSNQQGRPGSTIFKMIRKTGIPVLIVPESCEFRMIQHIILAVDFNETVSSSQFEVLFELIRQLDASLTVIHVEHPAASFSDTEFASKLSLGKALGSISYTYEKIEAHLVEPAISKYVNSHPAHLLAMVAHPHSFFERIFGQTHTLNMLEDIRLPLLVLKNGWIPWESESGG